MNSEKTTCELKTSLSEIVTWDSPFVGSFARSDINLQFVTMCTSIIMSSTGGISTISTVDSEDNHTKRQIRESIFIRQHGGVVMNRDEGLFDLSHVWDNVLPPIRLGGSWAKKT